MLWAFCPTVRAGSATPEDQRWFVYHFVALSGLDH
jgi:hypothetical protein